MKQSLADRISGLALQGSPQELVNRFIHHLKYVQGKDQYSATPLDIYLSFAGAVKDVLLDRWLKTQPEEYAKDSKRVYYLSLEYLIGRSLGNAILNLDLEQNSLKALKELGYNLDVLQELEWDAGLGNGGLGRLAACFLDSLASLRIPAYGYGIRYEYGIFFQHLKAGQQVETPDNWLRYGSVWEVQHPEHLFPVYFGGDVELTAGPKGIKKPVWHPSDVVMAMACDYLVPGFRNGYVNTLRLWAAKSSRDFDLRFFNEGDYVHAVSSKNHSELISKVLYPKDDNLQGKELRLRQEYFFVSATIQDILRRFDKKHNDLSELPNEVAIQLNDTHPAIAVAELMRVLTDVRNVPFDKAWEITQGCMAYTNHTILPEALEKWQVSLFHSLLPRHLQIIYELNQRFIDRLISLGSPVESIRKLSLIEEEPVKSVRMANLAILGSHSVNGVSALHTEILKDRVFPEFYQLYPQRFNNKTNGITPRRWLMLANPNLSELLTTALGEGWMNDTMELHRLKDFNKDKAFLLELNQVKHRNKLDFAKYLYATHKIRVNPESIFDFQAKRIHEYKRQLLNALHIIHLALAIKNDHPREVYPHTFFFAGKAAPGYYQAKLIIRFINAISNWLQRDKELSKLLQVVFLPNYSVSLAQRIMPASEVSQQISTAGTEASGTGNMKFALNGALTVGTLDGANIEMREAAGPENFFIFGMTAEEVAALKTSGYHPYSMMQADARTREVFQFLATDELNPLEPGLFDPLVESLLHLGDNYCLIADFPDYIRVMQEMETAYADSLGWAARSLANIAGMADFSSDETIKRYAHEIWKVI